MGHTVWSASLFLLATLCLRIGPDGMLPGLLFPVLMCVGFAYGANTSVMPAFYVKRFNNAYVGVSLNITTAVMSCVVFLVSKLVGLLYDFEAMASSSKASAKAASGETDAAFCRGAHCWRGAFTIGIMLRTAG